MQAILDFIAKVADVAMIGIQLGQDIAAFVAKIKKAASTPNWQPTKADWDELAALEKPLRDALNAKQPGDPS